MRIAKLLLALSLSVFLFSASWALLTGRVLPVADARAQDGDRFVSIGTADNGLFVALTESGEVWEFRHSTAREFNQVAKLGQLGEE